MADSHLHSSTSDSRAELAYPSQQTYCSSFPLDLSKFCCKLQLHRGHVAQIKHLQRDLTERSATEATGQLKQALILQFDLSASLAADHHNSHKSLPTHAPASV